MSVTGKILFISFGELSKTGCLRAYHLTLCLRQLGWDAHIAVPDCESNRESEQAATVAPFYFDPSPMKFRASVGAILKKQRPDFVHMLNPKEKALLLATTYPRTRFVFDWEDWTTFMQSAGPVKWYKEQRDGWLVRRASLVITASRWLSTYLLDRFKRDSLYMPYACLPKEFPKPLFQRAEPLAIGMGSLHPGWDHDLMIEAAGVLKRRGSELPIRWIGSGIELASCQARAAELQLERFEFPGYLDWEQMLRELREAHCLVFPIRKKPLNLARCPFKCFQFAQAARPVITSDVGEVRSILGDHAIYVEPTAEAIADAIAEVMSKPRQADVPYDLGNHRWENRAWDLSERLREINSEIGSRIV